MTALGRAGLVLVASALLGGSCLAQTPETYNAASGFSPIDNPNGVWSYGWEVSRGAAWNFLVNHNVDTRGIDWWYSGAAVGTVPAVWYNPTTVNISEYTFTVPAGKLAFHPGQSGENSVVRWTAPAAGTVTISGQFNGYDFRYPTTTDVAVLYNSATTLFSGEIASFNQPLAFSLTATVGLGDTIDFNVGYGTDDNNAGDTTGIDATIAYTTYVGPILHGISPASIEAGGPAITLQVKGSNFNVGSLVNWSVGKTQASLATTWVSPTLLQAAIPASLIATLGRAAVSVTTPNLGTSGSKPFVILPATLRLAKVKITKDANGSYVAALTLNTIGYQTLSSVTITKSTLNGSNTNTSLPLTVGDIAAGTSGTTTLTYPTSAGTKKSIVPLVVAGTFTGGKFSYSVKVTLP